MNARVLLVALVVAVLGLVPGLTACAHSTPAAVQTASTSVPGSSSGLRVVTLSSLPPQAADTYRLIRANGPFSSRQDGSVFGNREGVLPKKGSGYYHEYTVTTPGSSDRGARRIVTGSANEVYYTGDHYSSFQVVDVSR